MERKQIKLIGAISVGVVALLAAFFLLLHREKAKLEQDRVNFANLEKEAMQDELDKLSEEYDIQYNKLASVSNGEQKLQFSNDSLASQLISERAKVGKLLEELSVVKSTNSKRINELRGEVNTLRKVLKTYVVQIDSLNAANQRLRAENTQVKQNYERVSNEASKLMAEKKELTGKVNLAAKLQATSIQVRPLDKRGKSTKNIGRVRSLEISFTVAKNITAAVGEKTFYARILQPNDETLTKSPGDVFAFEGGKINFSCRKVVEYGGEEVSIAMYWPIEETLLQGQYRVDLFADGNLIGQKVFSL